MKHIAVIGGGIIGLSAAYYLQQAGYKVTVLDKADFSDNCSYGNAGYVCPSHFVPLAAPGIVWQGIKWMFNSKSPFYVKPSLNASLINWGWNFMKSANAQNVEKGAVPLRDISLLSQQEFEKWAKLPGFDFSYEHKGMLEVFQTHAVGEHAHHTVEKAQELGLDVSLLNFEELQALEPQTKINALGALFFKCDAHLYPNQLMKVLLAHLLENGVNLNANEEVLKFESRNNQISRIITNKDSYEVDSVVIAAGSWSRELTNMLGADIPLMPGRGYSITLEDSPYKVNHPIILAEGRVALTPMNGNKIRMGGTMEVVSTKTPPQYNRVEGILKSVKNFLPEFDISRPSNDQIWYGYRPCSADGLPYIGRTKKHKNVIVATGHSMMGLSLGAGTGKLVEELISEKQTSIDISAFEAERFG